MWIKYEQVHSLVWSFDDQFNQVIHNYHEVKWPISLVEMNIYGPYQSVCIFFIWLPFFIHFDLYKSIFWEAMPWYFIYIFDESAFGFGIIQLNTIFAPPFSSQTGFQNKTFSALSLLEINICRAFDIKINVRRYIGTSLHMYQDQIRLLTNHSWQASRSIYNNQT